MTGQGPSAIFQMKTEAQIVRANTYTNLLCARHYSKQLVLILVLTALLLPRRKLQQKEVK